MVKGKKIVVVLPAYNAGRTLKNTYDEIPFDIVDEVILTDDGSTDDTMSIARSLGISHCISHPANAGYGANQKTCYRKALELEADIVVMLHPDYQYTPQLIPSMVYLIANNVYPVVLGSRILGRGALKGGMPRYKYVANRFLTFFQNLATGAKLSEYHTGYRAFDSAVLRAIDFEANSNNFIFDNQLLSQILIAGFPIAEITCPTRYFPEASSIGFLSALQYGAGVLQVSMQHALQRMGVVSFLRYRKVSDGTR
ncbi:MAG: glycosyltransferase family 2 protein [Bacteroidia bacterium]|nr:glycosyltransferase family 2 protein [Bacteroidia bacterium]